MTDDWRPPTEAELAAIIREAESLGYSEAYTDGGRTDWDSLIDLFEGRTATLEPGRIDLGEDTNSPTIKAIKAAYRRGLKGDV